MTKNLKRYYGRGDLHFITFSCYQRLPLLGSAHARNLFVHALGKIRERHNFLLVGYVVMPEHVHLLISEAPTLTPSVVLKALKQRVSRDVRILWRQHSAGQPKSPIPKRAEPLPRFWQSRFYDFNVYTEEKKREKLDYIHANPVLRRLVSHPADWIWSSYLFYEKGEQGLVTIDPLAW